MRQRDDAIFAEALNCLADGILSPNQINIFKSREMPLPLQPPRSAVHLFNRNALVDAYNQKFIDSTEGEKIQAISVDIVLGSATDDTKRECLRKLHKLPTTSTFGLRKDLELKVGVPYMVTVNVDLIDGIVNGSTGTLKYIQFGASPSGNRRPITLFVDFDDPQVGKIARSKSRTRFTPIYVYKKVVYSWPAKYLSVVRMQFPITPSAAITIWKAQGISRR